MPELPYIDEHAVPVTAPADAIWSAMLRVLTRTMGGGAGFARLLGCDPATASGTFEGRQGDTLPGFRVAEAERGRRLALRGRHRFTGYALTFTIDGDRLVAESRGDFPGFLGALYRLAVIGTGAHRLITRRMLRQMARESVA